MTDGDIYRPHSRLVRIMIGGRWFEVPENNILLRCFQFLAPEVPYGPFCWNGDCENDRICYRSGAGSESRNGLSCQTMVREGMEIDLVSPELRRAVSSAFAAEEAPATADEALQAEPLPTPTSR